MRLLSAVAVGILISTFLGGPAAAAVTITIRMEPKYLIEGAVRPTVTISGASGNATLTYRRYHNGNCEGSPQLSYSQSASNGSYTGPDLQTGSPGPYSLRVIFAGTAAPCQPFLLQRKVSAAVQLAKSSFDSAERVEPGVALSGAAGDAAGQVEIGRWASAGCGPNQAVWTAILPVVGQPQGAVNLQDGSLGVKSFRAAYSGDERHAAASSPCRDYTVGAYIRGKVFQDADGSGTPEPDEAGKAGVTVTLRRPQGGTASVTTGDTGGYEFFVTSGGLYSVTLTLPAGFDKTTDLELSVQMVSSSVGERNFGVVELPSTLLPIPTPARTGGDLLAGPQNRSELSSSSEGFALARLLALGLVVAAAFMLLWLVFSSRSRREDDPF